MGEVTALMMSGSGKPGICRPGHGHVVQHFTQGRFGHIVGVGAQHSGEWLVVGLQSRGGLGLQTQCRPPERSGVREPRRRRVQGCQGRTC